MTHNTKQNLKTIAQIILIGFIMSFMFWGIINFFMQSDVTWVSTSKHELDRANNLLKLAKEREGKRKAHRVDGYWICLPASYTPEQVEKAIKKHRKEVKQWGK